MSELGHTTLCILKKFNMNDAEFIFLLQISISLKFKPVFTFSLFSHLQFIFTVLQELIDIDIFIDTCHCHLTDVSGTTFN